MDPFIGASLIGAGSSIVDNGLNMFSSNSANAKSKRAAMAASILQYQLQNQLMDKQNEYNKPINQMARLREAGLNPNLVYGDGGATMASASASVGSNMADITPASGTLNVLGKMQVLQQMKQSQANIAETEARTKSIDDNIELKRQELELRRDDLALQRQLVASQLGLRASQQRKVDEETRYMSEKSPVSFSSDPVSYAGNLIEGAFNYGRNWIRELRGQKPIKKGGR